MASSSVCHCLNLLGSTLTPFSYFVQLQAQPCCSSLNQNYSQQLTCLCLFLNKNSTLSSDFPIHQKLELQLPQLCSIPPAQFIWASSVSPPSINSTGSQVSLGAKNNKSIIRLQMLCVMGLGNGLKQRAWNYQVSL
ncbi:hypothetical protein Bca4012_096494 [Brassica carinata]|uniref:Bifunctional inhibitor/plant lipid transfer protein/seed storage helical domain-containing protein n=1 Tax=Brassica carinata TaxID=52824 RepID=A0A8X7U1B4_BRACI|nr:hypothetical protein Bca52824_078800 [Brassica carinata]